MSASLIEMPWPSVDEDPQAAWQFPAADGWPALTLTACDRRHLAMRVALTATGWLIANAPLTDNLDSVLVEWRTRSLAEWFDLQAPTCSLYATLADELATLWIGQVREALPARQARVVEEELDEWGEWMGEAWDNEAVVKSSDPITRCYLQLVRQFIDEVTVGAAWAAGITLWRPVLSTPRRLARPMPLGFGCSD